MPERNTGELIRTLGDDVHRCHGELLRGIEDGERHADGSITADYGYHARQLIRAILAYIEGVTFSVKVSCIRRCDRRGLNVSVHERYAAVERDTELSDKGEIIERPAKLRLASNVRFALRLLERAERGRFKFDPSAGWWSDLQKTIKVRDRLTHPRMPEDIDISPDELTAAMRARRGFEDAVLLKKPRKKG